jgi:hypothetical protein
MVGSGPKLESVDVSTTRLIHAPHALVSAGMHGENSMRDIFVVPANPTSTR